MKWRIFGVSCIVSCALLIKFGAPFFPGVAGAGLAAIWTRYRVAGEHR